jgi:iron uptake system component EfeO
MLLAGGCGSSGDVTAGSGPPSLQRVEQEAVEKYRWFLEENAQALVQWTGKLRGQIVAADLTRAQSRYATARAQFGQIEQAAEQFEELDSEIDGPPGEGTASQPAGFHRIEKALFAARTTKGMSPPAKDLLAAVGRLHHELKTMDLRPVAILEGASKLMGQVSTAKLSGREEPYAHIDLVDVAANVEGAGAAFEAVRPLLAHEDLALVESIEAAFADAYAALEPTGSAAREPQSRAAAAGSGFLLFDELSRAQIAAIARPTETLARLLREAPARIEAFKRAY